MAEASKDTIYVDIDDEITSIIEKATSSHAKIIALVLPKRATVLQSVVNMKLLKRRCDKVGKNLVLVTSEAGLMPLAGAVGLHVAKTPTSKPEIPAGPVVDDLPEDIEEPDTANEPDFDADSSAAKSVGELAGMAAVGGQVAEDDTIELDNSAPAEDEAAAAAPVAAKKPKKPGNKKLRVPNFNKFRLRLFLGLAVLILLIAGYIICFKVLPKATIDIATNASNVNSRIDLNLDTNAASLNIDSGEVPAQTAQQQKTYTGQADASGKENKGDAATGSVTMTTCSLFPPKDVPAGTGVSTNGLTYITQISTSFNNTGFNSQNSCYEWTSSNIGITANKAGAQYNVDNADFTVNGRSDVDARGSASGGHDDIVTVVQQSDIDDAKKQINKPNADQYKGQLEDQLKQDGLYPIVATFTVSTHTKASAQPGDEAKSVNITEKVTYTMFGVKKSDLQKLIKHSASQQIDTKKQAILDNGLSTAEFEIGGKPSSSQASVSMSVTSVAGPHLDKAKIAKQAAGKKAGDIKSMIEGDPGVKGVTVDYSPFWVSSTPSNPSKINVIFEEPAQHKD